MEIIIKVIITITVLLFSFKIIYWTWTSHIDPNTTIQRYISKKPTIADALVTRDPNKIYQNSDPVGNVTGSVKTQKKQVIFEEIFDLLFIKRRPIHLQPNPSQTIFPSPVNYSTFIVSC